MAAADTARLVAELSLDVKGFNQGLGRVEQGLNRLGTKSTAIGTAIGVGVERLAEKGIGALFGAIDSGIDSLHQLQDIGAQTQAVITSTGGAAGLTAQQIRDMANAIEDATTADDKQVQNAENLLLTFTKIGKDVFPDATKAVVNMGIAFNQGNAEGADFQATAIQVGKALNDPIKGITALRKAGVSFTAQQEKQIKALVKAGKVEDAQKLILHELASEFGKAGEAAGTSGAAGARRLNDAVEDLQISLATGLAPALNDIQDELGTALKDPKVQKAVRDLGVFLGDAAKAGLKFAQEIPWDKVASALKTAAGFAGDLIKAFTSLPPEAQATIIALAGLNKLSGGAVTGIISELGKGLIKGVLGITAAQVNIKAAVVTGAGGGPPGAPGAKPGATGVTGVVKDGLEAGFKLAIPAVIGGVVGGIIAHTASGAIDPGTQNRIDNGATPLANRDPRRFNRNGQVVANLTEDAKTALKNTSDNTSKLVGLYGVSRGDQAKLLNVTNERLDALKSTQQQDQAAATAKLYAGQQAAKAATVQAQASAASSITAAQSRTTAAAQASAAAIRAKKLSVNVENHNIVTTSVSVRETIKGQTTFKSYYKTAS